jgi:3-deoxy-alpha-D-manno-octulosonate 8-oxidase
VKNINFNLFNVNKVHFGIGQAQNLNKILQKKKNEKFLFIIDDFFKNKNLINKIRSEKNNRIFYINNKNEPTTSGVDKLLKQIKNLKIKFDKVLGIGGGSTLDTAKAISNLLTNPGPSKKYQGWNLLKKKGIYKIGIPTLSGTGAESSRTCVLMDFKTDKKLGMNSEFSIFDEIILDPDLIKTVNKNQYFYTACDTYIHCIESLNGKFRNPVADNFSNAALKLCREVFATNNLKSKINRSKLMLASYYGGCAISSSMVGIIHPLSAALSIVFKFHHCLANCIAFKASKEFYPKEYKEFNSFIKKHNIFIPKNICKKLSNFQKEKLYRSTIIHSKPLKNALGNNYERILTKEKIIKLFESI